MADRHIIGLRVLGRMGRFSKELSGREFHELLSEVGGVLPREFVAWHLANGETVQSSLRVKAIAQHPLILDRHGALADPAQAIRNAYERSKSAVKELEEAKSEEVTLLLDRT